MPLRSRRPRPGARPLRVPAGRGSTSLPTAWASVELARLRGHLTLWGRSIHHAGTGASSRSRGGRLRRLSGDRWSIPPSCTQAIHPRESIPLCASGQRFRPFFRTGMSCHSPPTHDPARRCRPVPLHQGGSMSPPFSRRRPANPAAPIRSRTAGIRVGARPDRKVSSRSIRQ